MSHTVKPVGRVTAPLIIFGFASLLLGTATEAAGAFEPLNDLMRSYWRKEGWIVNWEIGLPGPVGVFLTAAFSFGLIGAILGTPGFSRRLALGLSAILLAALMGLSFAVWGLFWKPYGCLVAVGWAWFSSIVYAQLHQMPCDHPGND